MNLKRNNRKPDTLKLFKFNVLAFPKSTAAFDDLAKAYLDEDSKDLAIKTYEKILELDPENKCAKKNIKKIKI